jgi:hypothetical protein
MAPGMGGARVPRAMPGVQLTNTTRVTLDYNVDRVGPSGIAKVELHVTQDDGRTWRFLADDQDLKSPIVADLPGEGVYGLTLVVVSGAGLGRRPPQQGDFPQMKIQVDTTAPQAELYAPELAPSQRDALVLTWKATDSQLTTTPICLYWAERPDGNWQPIGSDLPNTGSFVWKLPASVPYQVYLRLTVRDSAGTVSVAETAKPILVDLNEPQGELIRVVGTNRGPQN